MGQPYSGDWLATRNTIGRYTQAGQPINLNLPNTYVLRPQTEEERLNQRLQQMLQAPGQQRRLAQERDLLANIKEIFQNFPREIKIENAQGLLQVSMGGATAELRAGASRTGVNVELDGTPEVYVETGDETTRARVASSPSQPMQFQVSRREMTFAGTPPPDHWEVKFSIGSLVPDLNELPSIFRQGKNSLRGDLTAVGELNQTNVSTVTQAVEPHIHLIKDSIKAASQIAQIRHRVNFSLNARGPTQHQRGRSPIRLADHKRRSRYGSRPDNASPVRAEYPWFIPSSWRC